MEPRSPGVRARRNVARHNLAAGLLHDLTATPRRFGLPGVNAIRPASGGLVHHVWLIETDRGRYYAKIRGETLAGVAGIPCEPRDIEYEAQALRLFRDVAPKHFPEIVHCDPGEGLLILTDVVADGQCLESLLTGRAVTPKIAFRLGETLRAIHERSSIVTKPIRGDREEAYRRLKLEHKLGPACHSATAAVVERLAQGHHLILGDPSPKNIAYRQAGDYFTFYDLEDAHLGHSSFDTGFLAGHLLLHNYLDLALAQSLVQAFCDGYGETTSDDLAQFVAAATFHYRLNVSN